MAAREHVASVASNPPQGFEMEEGSPPNFEDNPPPAEDVNKLPLRHSVIMMEVSPRRRYIGIGITLAVSLFFVFFTPIYVVERFRLVPQKPDTTNLQLKMELYQNFTEKMNVLIAAEMYRIYNESVEWEQETCSEKLDFIYNEQEYTKAFSKQFVESYCWNATNRVMETAQQLLGVAKSSLPSCIYSPTLDLGNSRDDPQEYVHWLVSENDLDAEYLNLYCANRIPIYDDATDTTTDYCVMSLYLQQGWCDGAIVDLFRWDDHFDFYSQVDADHLKCATVQDRLEDKYLDTVTSNSLGFKESVEERRIYDSNYFLGSSGQFSDIDEYVKNIQDAMPSIENGFSSWNSKFQANAAAMQNLYTIYQDVTFGVDLSQFPGLGNLALDPPDLTYPPYPAEELEEINEILEEMSTATEGLKEYNPPIVTFPEPESVLDFSAPTVEFQQADIDFKASTLIEDVTNTWNNILTFVNAFQVADFLIRICLFLHDVAFILQEQRRDMTSLKTRARNCSALILENLVILVYVVVIAVIAGYAATSDFDVSNSIRNEAQTSCTNDIIIKNSEILVDYQNDVAKMRSECNAGLSNENAKLENVNSVFVDAFEDIYLPWEKLFNSTQPVDEYTFTSGGSSPVTYTDFPPSNINVPGSPSTFIKLYIPPVYTYKGRLVTLVGATAIELYAVNDTICQSSPEAIALGDAVNGTVNNYIDYIVGVLVCALGMIIAMRMFVWGLRFIFWMEITKGYAFDEEFNSARLKTRIRNERIKGVVMILISSVIFFVMLGIYA